MVRNISVTPSNEIRGNWVFFNQDKFGSIFTAMCKARRKVNTYVPLWDRKLSAIDIFIRDLDDSR